MDHNGDGNRNLIRFLVIALIVLALSMGGLRLLGEGGVLALILGQKL